MSQEDEFLRKVLKFVDRNGSVKSKSSTPMSCSLEMTYEDRKSDIRIDMHASAHGMGNGSCGAKVYHKGDVVYDAGASYTSGPFGTKVKVYEPGRWEELIR